MAQITPNNRPDLLILVDDDDLPLAQSRSWYVQKGRGYAAGSISGGFVLLHRLIMKVTDRTVFIDHKNGNRLDNRKENLRIVTRLENDWNKGVTSRSKSGYRGVYECVVTRKWIADITKDGVRTRIGKFATREEAAIARNTIAKEFYGEYARPNLAESGHAQPPVDITKKRVSFYRGVYYCKTFKRWTAVIFVNKKQLFAGRHDSEIIAAIALRNKMHEVCPERLKLKRHANLPSFVDFPYGM